MYRAMIVKNLAFNNMLCCLFLCFANRTLCCDMDLGRNVHDGNTDKHGETDRYRVCRNFNLEL